MGYVKDKKNPYRSPFFHFAFSITYTAQYSQDLALGHLYILRQEAEVLVFQDMQKGNVVVNALNLTVICAVCLSPAYYPLRRFSQRSAFLLSRKNYGCTAKEAGKRSRTSRLVHR